MNRRELLQTLERMRLENVNMGTRPGIGRHVLSIPPSDFQVLRMLDPEGLGRPIGSPEYDRAMRRFLASSASLPYRVGART
jgi:hypothetical protein